MDNDLSRDDPRKVQTASTRGLPSSRTPVLRRIARVPFLGRGLLFWYRLGSGLSATREPALSFLSWLFTSREYTNYTSGDFMMDNRFVVFAYDIDPEFP